jgi:hypothetical protein
MLASLQAFAQTSISGIINTYLSVTGIAAGTGTCDAAGGPSFTLSSVTGLSTTSGASGNKVLVIQMMAGAAGTVNNGVAFKFSSTYGAVTNYGGAGNYEFAFISTIVGSVITFTKPLVNTYDMAGKVQIIPVVVYPTGVTTSGIVTGQAWNGTTGGVLLLEAPSLALNHNFDMLGKGFAGGVAVDKSSSCCNTSAIDLAGNRFGYYFDETLTGVGCNASHTFNYGNDKGTGIFPLIVNQRLGRGAFANAGGGGSGHNSGGGGGGNCGAGGLGGYEYGGCAQSVADNMGGIGGYTMSNGATAVFMGGGAGSGHGNDNGSTSGGNGGGIIILNITSINATAASLKIDASGAKIAAIANSDGAGGGGAGGSILLNVTSFSGSAMSVTANGGNGGDNSSAGTCHAVGGGGGGGYISTSATIPIAGVTLSSNGGAHGIYTIAATQTSCGAYGSLDGTSCTPAAGLVLNQQSCSLPVEFLNFYAKNINSNSIELIWNTASEVNNAYFEIMRSSDGLNWKLIQTIPSANKPSAYSAIDRNLAKGNYYYKIRQVDLNGQSAFSGVISAETGDPLMSLMINPNIVSQGETYSISLSKGIINGISITDLRGTIIYQNNRLFENILSLSSQGINSGFYFINVLTDDGLYLVSKLIIQ